jgi:sterol 3beta-glucosyltransferase
MARIAVVASGTRGDVQPYVALGAGLKHAGHDVRLIASENFASLAESAGLDFAANSPDIEQMLQSDAWRETTESGNFLKILGQMQAEMKRAAAQIAALTPPLLADAELIVTGMSGMGGPFSIAETRGIPVVQAYVVPFTPTRAYPSPLVPTLPFGGALNPASFHVMRQMMWQSSRLPDTLIRKQFGLRPRPLTGPYRAMARRDWPTLYGFSPQVLPVPADWPDDQHVTGYWFLGAAEDWSPPADLEAFLAAGPAPVYIGFGSMGSRNLEQSAHLALEALRLSGQRGVLSAGWGGMASNDLPDSVHMVGSLPHTWLFERMAAVVHHGGAGTTAAGLRAGVPSVIVPHMGDQAFWGRRVADLGAGPAPIPRKKLTAERLAQAIDTAVSHAAMRARADELGQRIRSEDGVGRAVAIIDGYLAGKRAGG